MKIGLSWRLVQLFALLLPCLSDGAEMVEISIEVRFTTSVLIVFT
jgi:hypothetical protein